MKRFLLRVGLFLILMPLGWAVLFALAMMNSGIESRFIAQERNWGFVNAKSLEWAQLRHSTPFDVLAFGSSTCYSGIDPRAFEERDMKLFNFCSSSQSIPHSLPLIEAAFEDQTPEVLLLDVYPAIWDKETVSSEPVRDWIVNGNLWDTHWAKAYGKLTLASHAPFAWMIMLYYPFRRMLSPAGKNATEDPNGLYEGRGFVFRTFPALSEVPSDDPRDISMSSTVLEALIRISDLCESRGVKLMLINPPQLVEEVFDPSTVARDFVWIDGNQWPGAKRPSNFYDDHHLVGEGALRYSEWLSLQVTQIQKVP